MLTNDTVMLSKYTVTLYRDRVILLHNHAFIVVLVEDIWSCWERNPQVTQKRNLTVTLGK